MIMLNHRERERGRERDGERAGGLQNGSGGRKRRQEVNIFCVCRETQTLWRREIRECDVYEIEKEMSERERGCENESENENENEKKERER